MRLQEVLDEALDMLMHTEFKNFGGLQKARYQNNKSEDEIFIRSNMYTNMILDPKVIAKQVAKRKAFKNTQKGKETLEKARTNRKNWYKDPKNREAFMEKIRKREEKRKYLKALDKKS